MQRVLRKEGGAVFLLFFAVVSLMIARFNGGFNHIACISVTVQADRVERFTVRVPAIGTTSRWQEGDAHNLRCEMALLKHLRQNVPNTPVPDVVAFADTLDTVLGAPFCLMKRLPGKPAHHIWFEDIQQS